MRERASVVRMFVVCVCVPHRLHCANDEANTTRFKHQNANEMRFICNIRDESVCPTAALKIFNIHFETFMMELRGRQQKPFHISIQTDRYTHTHMEFKILASFKQRVSQPGSAGLQLVRNDFLMVPPLIHTPDWNERANAFS